MSIFIGGAWPYANGSLHVGHLAALLPGDIIARYYRLKGEEVLYVSGSDCNGTPIEIRAKKEGVEVEEIADRYHWEFQNCFERLGFTFDHYGRTDSEVHHREVQNIFLDLVNNGLLYERTTEETYCTFCSRFLPDRFVEGQCSACGENARGDQCDKCGTILDAANLLQKVCKLCGNPPVLKETDHFYLTLSKLEEDLRQYLSDNKEKWRENAVHLTERYLNEGLRDRAVTRDIASGVPVPAEGYEGKKIYVWIEAVSGYLTGSIAWGEKNNRDWQKFWSGDSVSYYVHGKDNIPFHTIIWPAVLKGLKAGSLPEWILSSEYVTLEKKKISTSRDWAVWLPDVLENYHPDSLRYYFSVNYPDNKDADFSWREFIHRHNSDLLGSLGNFVQRTVKFYRKEFGNDAVLEKIEPNVAKKLQTVYLETGELLERGEVRKAARTAFETVHWSNKYFDAEQPWKVIKEDREKARLLLENCLYICLNLSVLLSPFIPFTSEQIRKNFQGEAASGWKPIENPVQVRLSEAKPLFTRIPEENIEIERLKLG